MENHTAEGTRVEQQGEIVAENGIITFYHPGRNLISYSFCYFQETTKISLAKLFTQLSGMTLEWSVKCLEQNDWDLEMAKVNFNVAKSKGKIPPHAFQS